MQINSDAYRTIKVFISGAVICYVTNLAIKNKVETTLKFKNISLTLKSNITTNEESLAS